MQDRKQGRDQNHRSVVGVDEGEEVVEAEEVGEAVEVVALKAAGEAAGEGGEGVADEELGPRRPSMEPP